MKKIKIEDLTPYHKSIKWDIHNNYFQNRGNEAWKTREVPFDITSNSQASYQNAYAAFRIIDKSNHKKGKPILILEIASGLGIFALNFIKVFKEICKQNGKDYHEDVHYMFTDYSLKNLEDASKNKYIAKLKENKLLDFYLLDALNPKDIKNMNGEKFFLEKESLTLVIANYLYCTLPVRIIRKKDNKYYEKNIEMYFNLNDSENYTQDEINKIITDSSDQNLFNRLEEVSHYNEINLDTYIQDDILRDSFITSLIPLDIATVELPVGACESINKLIPFIKKTGAFIISDKGYANISYMYGEHECFFSIHGNSFAHSLNFPLLDIYLSKKELFSIRTDNEQNSLQVMLITKQNDLYINNEFSKQFIDTNYNEDTHDFMDTAYKEKVEKNFGKAIRYYIRCLKYRKHDIRLFFELGNAYIGYGDYKKALDILLNKPEDYLDEFDFDFEIAMAYDYLQYYSKALDFYYESNNKFPNQRETLFNIGNVYHKMKDYKQAYMYYHKALEISNDYDVAFKGLSNLKDDMFNDWLTVNKIDNISIKTNDFDYCFNEINKEFDIALNSKVDLENLQNINNMYLNLISSFPDKIEIYAKLALLNYIIGDIEKSNEYINKVKSSNFKSNEIKELEKLISNI
ncbi:MAG: tetratricopeptide repeat protein [Candidatus Sericytochromatia bacterium]